MMNEKPKSLNDLPDDIRTKLQEERLALSTKWYKNDGFHLLLVNAEGTRYFEATRKNDFYGGSCTYNEWRIRFGKVLWRMDKQPMTEFGGRSFDDYDYRWVRSNTCFGKSSNGTVVPSKVDKKSEVIEIAKAIGIFNL